MAVERDVVPSDEDVSGKAVEKETTSVGVVIDAAFGKDPSPILSNSPNGESENGGGVADKTVTETPLEGKNTGKAGMVVASSAASEQSLAVEGKASSAAGDKQAVAGIAASEGSNNGEEPTFGDT
ncbi:MAG: hypothetical protein AABY74_08005, partial [Planctomycetota bacterium]